MQLNYDDDRHVLVVSGEGTYQLREVLRCHGGKLDTDKRSWVFPASALRDGIVQALQNHGAKVEIDRSVLPVHAQDCTSQAIRTAAAVEVDWATRTAPYQHQNVGTAWLVQSRRAMLLDDMGLGKTKQAIDAANKVGGHVMVVCPNSLKQTWADQLLQHHAGQPDIQVLRGPSKQKVEQLVNVYDCDGMFQIWAITNYESLQWMEKADPGVVAEWVKGKTVIFDECLPYETMVLTNIGNIPIGRIVEEGLDPMVLAYDSSSDEVSYRKITGRWKRPANKQLVEVWHEFGSIVCTEDHKIWTEQGYIQAGLLGPGDELRLVRPRISEKEMANPLLWEGLFCQVENVAAGSNRAVAQDRSHGGGSQLRKSRSCHHVQENEATQPDVGSDRPREDAAEIDREEVQGARRERTHHSAAEEDCGCPGMADRGLYPHPTCAGSVLAKSPSESLQRRCGEPRPTNSNRSGWEGAQTAEKEGTGHEKGFRVVRSRVERVESVELGSGWQHAPGVADGSRLYDIEVEGLHNFVANEIVVSNCHRLKNGLANVTKLVSGWSPARIWLLTGTPIANRPEDLYSLISLVRPGYVGWSWYAFERRHIIRGNFNEIKAYKELDELRDKLADVSLGRKKEDCLDLPERIYITVHCELSAPEMTAYKRMHETLETWMDDQCLEPGQRPTMAQAQTFATRYLRLRQITDGLVSAGVDKDQEWSKDLTKLRTALETWEDAGRPKAVIWYQWVPVGLKLQEVFQAAGANVYRVGGDVKPEHRNELIEKWKTDANAVLLGQMAVAGEGLNLHASDWQMFVDLPSTPKQRCQCVDRLHRIGQKNTVRIVDLVAKNTVDDRVLKTLKEKLSIADDVESAAYGLETEWESMSHGQ
jgi:hypothetical protein